MMNVLRKLLKKISPVRPVNVAHEVRDPSRGKSRVIEAVELSDFPLEDGSYGSVVVNGKVVPIQRSLPLMGYVCARCGFPTEYPQEHGGDLYCSELCAHEDGHKVGVGEHILEMQRQERVAKTEPYDTKLNYLGFSQERLDYLESIANVDGDLDRLVFDIEREEQENE